MIRHSHVLNGFGGIYFGGTVLFFFFYDRGNFHHKFVHSSFKKSCVITRRNHFQIWNCQYVDPVLIHELVCSSLCKDLIYHFVRAEDISSWCPHQTVQKLMEDTLKMDALLFCRTSFWWKMKTHKHRHPTTTTHTYRCTQELDASTSDPQIGQK